MLVSLYPLHTSLLNIIVLKGKRKKKKKGQFFQYKQHLSCLFTAVITSPPLLSQLLGCTNTNCSTLCILKKYRYLRVFDQVPLKADQASRPQPPGQVFTLLKLVVIV